MKRKIFKFLIIATLLLGQTTLAVATTIKITDPDPFSGTVNIALGDSQFYSHNIVDNGYDPTTDSILDATLNIGFHGDAYSGGEITHDFVGTEEELTVSAGDRVQIIKDVGEWLFVRDNAGNEGYVQTANTQQGYSLFPTFQLSIDGAVQNAHTMRKSNEWYDFSIPVDQLTDGVLNINVLSLLGSPDFLNANLYVEIERIAPVPEPTTVILFSIGLLSLAGINRRKNSKK